MADGSTAISNSQVADLVENLDKLEVLDSGGTPLVTFDVTWTSPTSGQLRVSGTPITATAANGGTAATVRLYDSGGSGEEITGIPVGTQGPPIELSDTSISAGQDVDLRRFYVIGPFSDPVLQSFSISPSNATLAKGDTTTWSIDSKQPMRVKLRIRRVDQNANVITPNVVTSSASIDPTATVTYSSTGRYYHDAVIIPLGGTTEKRSNEGINNNPDEVEVGPFIDSATVESSGDILTVVFNQSVTRGSIYTDNAWTLNVGSNEYSLTYSSGSGSDTWTLSIGQTVSSGETVTLDYDGQVDGIEDSNGGDQPVQTGISTTNNSGQTASISPTLQHEWDFNGTTWPGFADSVHNATIDTAGPPDDPNVSSAGRIGADVSSTKVEFWHGHYQESVVSQLAWEVDLEIVNQINDGQTLYSSIKGSAAGGFSIKGNGGSDIRFLVEANDGTQATVDWTYGGIQGDGKDHTLRFEFEGGSELRIFLDGSGVATTSIGISSIDLANANYPDHGGGGTAGDWYVFNSKLSYQP